MNITRCKWCLGDELLLSYHDQEWGVPLHNDKKHFEYITLEVMQCGLNWLMMLKKRDIIRDSFDNFDYEKIACYSESDIQRIMLVEGMIHSERKIKAIINNAIKYKELIDEYGSFDKYIWSFTGEKTYIYSKHLEGQREDHNELSDAISKDLKKKGFKFLGSITVFSHLQAAGIINDHTVNCWRFKELNTPNCIIK